MEAALVLGRHGIRSYVFESLTQHLNYLYLHFLLPQRLRWDYDYCQPQPAPAMAAGFCR